MRPRRVGSSGFSLRGARIMITRQIGRLIECLESARSRPAMYFGAVDVEAAMHFLNGVGLAVKALLGDNIEIRRQVLITRGWDANAMHPSQQMIDRGLTPADAVDEMLVIEIETIRWLVGD